MNCSLLSSTTNLIYPICIKFIQLCVKFDWYDSSIEWICRHYHCKGQNKSTQVLILTSAFTVNYTTREYKMIFGLYCEKTDFINKCFLSIHVFVSYFIINKNYIVTQSIFELNILSAQILLTYKFLTKPFFTDTHKDEI